MLISYVVQHSNMGGPTNRGSMIARVYNHLREVGPMASVEIYDWYREIYLTHGSYSSSAFGQILRRCGCFIPVGEKQINRRYLMGNKTNITVTVWDIKPIEDIVKPYLSEDSQPLRKLSKMPAFIRKEVKIQRGDFNDA